jgi:hypothetical protein
MLTREETLDVRDPNMEGKQADPFDAPVPGQSLTDTPGQAPYENPPQESDPKKVLLNIIKKMQQPKMKEGILESVAQGMPVEFLVKIIVKGGFAQGKISPDVAELITPAITVHIIHLASEKGIPVRVFMGEGESEEDIANKDRKSLEVMMEQRPELVEDARGAMFEQELGERAKVASERASANREIDTRSREMAVPSDGTFMEMGEG